MIMKATSAQFVCAIINIMDPKSFRHLSVCIMYVHSLSQCQGGNRAKQNKLL